MEKKMSREEVHVALGTVIKELRKSREEAAKASKNGLKRNPFDTLEDKGLMNAYDIMDEFYKIQAKASQLSSNERRIINKIMLMALYRVARAEKKVNN